MKTDRWKIKRAVPIFSVVMAIIAVAALAVVSGCSGEAANGGVEVPDSSQRILKGPDHPYDPDDDRYYYDYEPDSSSDRFNSYQVYLHDVNKEALEKLVAHHLDAAKGNIEISRIAMDADSPSYDEDYPEDILPKYTELADLLEPLLEQIKGIDEADEASLEKAYRTFHEILYVPDEKR